MRRILGIASLAVCVLALGGSYAAADWNPGEFAKWVQLPDLTDTGMDIWNERWDLQLADDFYCISQDPITDIHLWGSWLGDEHEGIAGTAIRLYIYEDDPIGSGGVDPDNTWSKPGNLLWESARITWATSPSPDHFTERVYYTLPVGDHEIFWDPVTKTQMGTDTKIWQYNIYIDPDNAFVQQGTLQDPLIYWLGVCFFPEWEDEEYGWKTRDPEEFHFMDDAVYWDEQAGGWYPLVYPLNHPYEGESIDLAFVITPEPATVALLALGIGGLLLKRKRA